MALPRGIRNNNPLNIRKGNNWKGERQHQTDNAFEEFVSIEYGLRAAFKILRNWISGKANRGHAIDTIEKIVSRWAPPSENNTDAYINYVSKRSGIDPRERIWFTDRRKIVAIVEAMAMYENGVPLDTARIESAYDLV